MVVCNKLVTFVYYIKEAIIPFYGRKIMLFTSKDVMDYEFIQGIENKIQKELEDKEGLDVQCVVTTGIFNLGV